MLEILSLILKIVFIVFFFGFCVFIHEFGHLIVALWQGLHVEKFSIGMGPKMCGFKYRGVEYVVSWLPFGGYVSLPQLDPTDTPVTSDEKPLPHAGPKARALTAFAGPFFNVIFGFVLATIMWGVGLWRPAASTSVIVADIPAYLPTQKEIAEDTVISAIDGVPVEAEKSPMTWEEFCYLRGAEAESLPETLKLSVQDDNSQEIRELTLTPEVNPEWAAGVRAGDRIFGVNGKGFTAGTDEFQKEYVYGNTGHVTLNVIRDGKPLEFSYQPQKNPAMEGLGFPFFETVNPVQIAQVAAGSPAEAAGVQEGDQLLAFGGKNITGPMQFLETLKEHSGEAVEIIVARNGRELAPMVLNVPAGTEPSDAAIGISFYVIVTSVLDGSPAAQAGIAYGDRFLELHRLDADGKEALESLQVRDVQTFREFVQATQGNPVRAVFERNGKRSEAVMTPTKNAESGKYVLGVIITGALPKSIQHVDPWTQFTEVIGTSLRTLGLLFAPITGRVKSAVTGQAREVSKTQIGVQHMSGPLGIVYALWYRIRSEGYRGGLSFIILITFSLALMNLLPLPVLDGGHIVFAAIEGITRRRIPVTFFKYIYNTFAILLIALMLYITLFDGRRILKRSGLMDSKKSAPVAQEVPAPAADEVQDQEVPAPAQEEVQNTETDK